MKPLTGKAFGGMTAATEQRITDQGGTVHEFDYDKLGRQILDRVTTLGSGVDGAAADHHQLRSSWHRKPRSRHGTMPA
ncbi:MAG: hypothetical protein R3C59_23245 [Planctomycetaceae bacterium]